ncbi:MAG: cell division protein SepF [Bacillaceae bacterium]|nr:cell division protein SepF [Bacillaceae bacterium]
MSLKSKFKRFFYLEDDYNEYEELVSSETAAAEEMSRSVYHDKKADKSNIVSLQSVQKSSKVILVEPRSYEEVQEIADHLKSRKAIIINLQRVGHDQGKRVVDFLSGTVYAIGGDIQKLGDSIFLCTPDNIDVAGAISDLQYED